MSELDYVDSAQPALASIHARERGFRAAAVTGVPESYTVSIPERRIRAQQWKWESSCSAHHDTCARVSAAAGWISTHRPPIGTLLRRDRHALTPT
jgi:hypothetical protein